MRVVYIDTLFFLNLAVDYLLLLLTARLVGVYRSRGWLAFGAAVGALLAVVLYFPLIPVLPGLLLRGGACLLTVLAAFGKQPRRRFVHVCGTFVLLTMLLAGAVFAITLGKAGEILQNGVLYLDISGAAMLIAFTAMYLLSGLVMGKGKAQTGQSRKDILVEMASRRVRFRALCDSGNLLRDPISGRRVMLVQSPVAAQLFDGPGAALLQNLQDQSPEELLPQLRRCCKTAFWLLPVHTVNRESMLIVFRPEKIWIEDKVTDEYLLGLSPSTLEISGDCQALIGV